MSGVYKTVDSEAVPGQAAPSVGEHEHRRVLAERVEALAIELRTLSDRDLDTIPSKATLAGLAGKIYSARRAIDKVFGLDGFAQSPAWDLMLDLYQARARGKQVSVTSACIGGACPATTGLRWLQALENMALITRSPDPEDKRRLLVALTDAAIIKIETALISYL